MLPRDLIEASGRAERLVAHMHGVRNRMRLTKRAALARPFRVLLFDRVDVGDQIFELLIIEVATKSWHVARLPLRIRWRSIGC